MLSTTIADDFVIPWATPTSRQCQINTSS